MRDISGEETGTILSKIGRVALSVLSLVLLLSALTSHSFPAEFPLSSKGPKAEDLTIHFYPNVESAYSALEAGDIDLIIYELTQNLYTKAVANLNIVLAPVADSGCYQIDLNSNYSILDYPGIRSPMNYTEMRQAIAWLTDKEYIVDAVWGGFAERIDQMIAAPYKGWANKSMWYPNYPYEYDPLAAKAILDSRFPMGTTPNPYYDAGFPGSSQYIRQYPAGHSKAGQDLDPLVVCVRSDDDRRFQAGTLVYENMRRVGIPVNAIVGQREVVYDRVMGQFNYHFYTGGWSVGSFPPLSLYGLYHSINAFPYGSNYVTGVRPGVPTHPKLDQLLNDGNYAPSHSAALAACKMAAGYMTEICVNIPLWSSASYWAWSKNLQGVVNMEGSGPYNDYTFMNAYKQDGSPIRLGSINSPNAMNTVYGDWIYDTQCLDRMNLYGLHNLAPYDLSVEQASFLRDWEIGTWADGGETKTKVTRWFRNDSYFAEPVTGNQKARVNSSQYFFTAWYVYQTGDAWCSTAYMDVNHIDIVDDFQVEIYFDTYNYLNSYYADAYLLPLDTFLQPPLSYHFTETFVEGVNLTTPGAVNLSGDPVWISSVTAGSESLVMFSEYNIVAPGKLEIFTSLTDGDVAVVDYWSVGDARGYTAGNLPWQTIFEGAGMYYATDFVPGDGGYLTLKRNPYYWMDTPALGEVDFVWSWEGDSKPRNGSYGIGIFDIVLAAAAYNSRGTGVPDDRWLPAADIAPQWDIIDIFDIVTLASRYGLEWGHS